MTPNQRQRIIERLMYPNSLLDGQHIMKIPISLDNIDISEPINIVNAVRTHYEAMTDIELMSLVLGARNNDE